MDLFKGDKNLKTLGTSNFEGKKIKNYTGNGGLLLVYANWCGHCMSLKPIWKQLAKVKGNLDMFVIDEAKDKNLIKQIGVKFYPSIFKISKDGKLKPYEKNRDMISLVNLLCNIDKKNKICKT